MLSKIFKGLIGLAVISILIYSCEKMDAQEFSPTLETRSIPGCPTLQYTQMSDSICTFSKDIAALQKVSINEVDGRLTVHGKNFSSVPGVTLVNDKSGATVQVDLVEDGTIFWGTSAKGYPSQKFIFFDKVNNSAIEINPKEGYLMWNNKGVKKYLKFQ